MVEMIMQQLPNFDRVRVYSNKFISQGSFAILDRTFGSLKHMKESVRIYIFYFLNVLKLILI